MGATAKTVARLRADLDAALIENKRLGDELDAARFDLSRLNLQLDEAWKATGIEGSVRGIGVSIAEIIEGRGRAVAEIKAKVAADRARLDQIRAAVGELAKIASEGK